MLCSVDISGRPALSLFFFKGNGRAVVLEERGVGEAFKEWREGNGGQDLMYERRIKKKEKIGGNEEEIPGLARRERGEFPTTPHRSILLSKVQHT